MLEHAQRTCTRYPAAPTRTVKRIAMVSIDMPSSVFPCSTRRGRGSSLPSCPASTAASIHEQEQQQDRALGIGVAFTNLLHALRCAELGTACACARPAHAGHGSCSSR